MSHDWEDAEVKPKQPCCRRLFCCLPSSSKPRYPTSTPIPDSDSSLRLENPCRLESVPRAVRPKELNTSDMKKPFKSKDKKCSSSKEAPSSESSIHSKLSSLLSPKTPCVEPSAPSPGGVLFNSEDQADIIFMVGQDPDVWRFPGHTFILAVASPVFDALFSINQGSISTPKISRGVGNTPEEEQALSPSQSDAHFSYEEEMEAKLNRVIELTDIKPDVFQNLLRFIYTKETNLSNIPGTLNVLKVANRFLVADLSNRCLLYLLNNVDQYNVLDIMYDIKLAPRTTDLHENENLKNELLMRCFAVTDHYADIILRQESFENLPLELVSEIVARDTLRVGSETVVFDSLVRWSCQECKRQRKELIPQNKRVVLGRSLFLVRFLIMSKDEFNKGPLISGILTDEEKNCFMARLQGDITVPLPEYIGSTKIGVKRHKKPLRLGSFRSKRALSPKSCSPTPSYEIEVPVVNNKKPTGKKSTSKKVLHGIGDFFICVIQMLD